jgi:hypothetical protein
MYYDVVSAKYLGKYKIEVHFKDKKWGIVDFKRYLEKGGVFELFKDINFFKQFKINAELGILVWGNGIDIAPETLYDKAVSSPR